MSKLLNNLKKPVIHCNLILFLFVVICPCFSETLDSHRVAVALEESNKVIRSLDQINRDLRKENEQLKAENSALKQKKSATLRGYFKASLISFCVGATTTAFVLGGR